MQSDLTVYKSTLEQQHSNNIQLRVLQDKLTHAQRDYEEVGETFVRSKFSLLRENELPFQKIHNLEMRHKNQMDEAQRRYDQLKAERQKTQRIPKEVPKHPKFSEVL